MLVVAIAVVALVILRPPPSSSPNNTASQNTAQETGDAASYKDAVNRLNAAIMQDDNETLTELLATDFVAHIPVNPMFDVSLDASMLTEVTSIFHNAVPDLNIESVMLVGEGNVVAQRVVITGEFAGEFYDYPPTGEALQFEANVFYRFDDAGKIAEQWIELDSATVMQALDIS